jgi:hypothetical protein
VLAADAHEAASQHAAAEEAAELALDEGGVAEAVLGALLGLLETGVEVLVDQVV